MSNINDQEKVSLSDSYITQSGHTVKLFDILDGKVFGVVNYNGWISLSWDEYGEAVNNKFNLQKIGKYDHLKIDDRVIVWDKYDKNIRWKRYFAGINEDGRPLAWDDGRTSWNADGMSSWDNCELVEE